MEPEDEVVLTSKNGTFELVAKHSDSGYVRYYVNNTDDIVPWNYVYIIFDKDYLTKKYHISLNTVSRTCNYDEAYEFADRLIEAADFVNEVKDILDIE